MNHLFSTAARHFLATAFLAACLVQPALAAKEGQLDASLRGAAPAVSVISGAPLTVRVGDEHSYQIFNADIPGVGQIYPPGATGTADMGWLVRVGETLYGPDFSSHSSSATGGLGTLTPYSGRTISAVSGAGTAASPFQVTVSNQLGASGLVSSEVVRYVNGDNYFTKRFTLTNNADGPQDVRVFLGGDIYLAGSDNGIPYLEGASNSVGGRDCAGSGYYILYIPQTPADSYSGSGYSSIWGQIGAGALSGSLTTTSCLDNGAALQWNRSLAPGQSVTLLAATSFGEIPGIAQFDITSVTPASGVQDSTVNVTIQGLGFAAGMAVGFGAGITVTDLVVVDGNTATATLIIAPDAALGFRDVTGISAGEEFTATLVNGFQVVDGELPPFQLISVTPNSGLQGATIQVTLQGTGFEPGMTVSFGNGITVSNLLVTGPGTATATLQIAPGATVGPRNVTAVLVPEIDDTLVNGFTVVAAGGPGPNAAQPVPSLDALGLLLLLLGTISISLLALRRHG